jgi:two-component system chemotaxis response regulator CheY
LRFLIIEDDYITAQVMIEILSAFGNSDWAEDGQRGIELFADNLKSSDPYSVIFLDIMLPIKDGQEVLTNIRDIESFAGIVGLDAIPIIMTTALDDMENVKKSFKNQCEGYIVKPIQKDKIISVLDNLDIL